MFLVIKQGECWGSASFLLPPFLLSLGSPVCGTAPPTFRVASPLQLNLLENVLQISPELCLPGDSQSIQVDGEELALVLPSAHMVWAFNKATE